jgi:hypothetical protein
MQPTDGVGEAGEIESEGSDGVELTCMGEEGLQIKFNGMTFTLPVNVVDAIKGFERNEEGQEEGSADEENVEHEESESPAEEEAEHAEGGSEENESESEEDEEEGKKNPFTEAKKVNPWAVCNASTGGKKKAGSKFEKCVLDVKKKSGIKK